MKSFKQLTEEIYKSGGSEVIMSKSEKDEIKSRKKMGIKIRKAKHAHTKPSKRKPTPNKYKPDCFAQHDHDRRRKTAG